MRTREKKNKKKIERERGNTERMWGNEQRQEGHAGGGRGKRENAWS